MKFDSEGDKDDKNETIKDERGWRESIQINQQGAPKSLMPSSSVVSKYDRGKKALNSTPVTIVWVKLNSWKSIFDSVH